MSIQEYMLYLVEKYIEPFFIKLDNYIDKIYDNYFKNDCTLVPKENNIYKEVENGNDKKYTKDWDIIEEV
tara:strand:+ start:766 stop:975 length:210 start_codon:yes stop_codon:yes gene_type:complete